MKRLFVFAVGIQFMTGLLCLVFAQATRTPDLASVVRAWGDTLAIDGRIAPEVDRYWTEKGNEPDDGYASELVAEVRKRIFSDVIQRLESLGKHSSDLEKDGEPFIEVTYLEPGFFHGEDVSNLSKTEQKFEKSFARTEVLAFFKTDEVSPEAALRVYTDPEFRQSVSSRIDRIWKDGDKRCVEVAGVKLLLSPIRYCNRIDELLLPDIAVEHSQAVENGGDDDNQTVYFKESLKTFVAVPGGLALYYVNYSRTIGVGGLQKSIARKKIKESQQKAIDKLAEVFASYNSDAPPSLSD